MLRPRFHSKYPSHAGYIVAHATSYAAALAEGITASEQGWPPEPGR